MTAWLTDTLITTGALIAMALVLRRPVARWFGAPMAYALWALPLLRMLLPPLLLPAELAPAGQDSSVAAEFPVMMIIEPVSLVSEGGATTLTASASLSWSAILLSIWLGGALAFIIWRFWHYGQMRREILTGARPVGEAGRIRLVESPAIIAPLAFGVFDKVVALPLDFMGQEDRAARDLALAHELAHHRGHDLLANFAAQLVLALHWFNPLAWYGWRAMRRDQEAACDHRVMSGRSEADRARYALLLANTAGGARFALAAPMACPVLGEKSIIHRLRSLARPGPSLRRQVAGKAGFAAAVLALPLTATITYAEASAAVEEVPVPPSVAATAEVPEPPLPPAAPEAPLPPEAPAAPEVKEIMREMRVVQAEAEEARAHARIAREEAARHRTFAREQALRHAEEARRHAEEMRREAQKIRRDVGVVVDRRVPFDSQEFSERMERLALDRRGFAELEAYFAEGGPFEQHMRELERELEAIGAADCENGDMVRRKLPDGKEMVIRCIRSSAAEKISVIQPVRILRAAMLETDDEETCREQESQPVVAIGPGGAIAAILS